MEHISEHHLMIFLIQFALLLGACKLVGLLFEKMKQPTITGDVLVGLFLGPAIFGRYAPELQLSIFPDEAVQWAMLGTVAWFGNLFLLMETGLDINFSRVWKQRGNAIRLSFADLTIPIVLSFSVLMFLPSHYLIDPTQRIIFSLFIAAIMTISALPVAIRGLNELGVINTDVGFLVVSALTLNDIVGWVLFTIILGVFSYGKVETVFVVKLVGFTLIFTLVSLTLLRRVVDKAVTFIHTRLGAETGYKTTFIVVIGMLFGAITLKIGIHSLFGFFIAGIVVGEAKHITEQDRNTIHRMVYSIFVPIFFAKIGLEIDILANLDWALVSLIFIIGVSSRFLGAWVGAKWAKQAKQNLKTIAIAHTPGGEMHIVIAMLALNAKLITEKVFVSIVTAAILSTIVFGPWLSIALKQLRKDLVKLIFGKDNVMLDSSSTTRTELLHLLIGNVATQIGIEESYLRREVLSREEQMSTAIGRGLAFPHAHIEGLSKAKLFVVKPANGIEWDSPDGHRVQMVFLVLTPADKPETQLQLMQSLTAILRKPKLLAKLLAYEEPAKIYTLLKDNIAETTSFQLQNHL
ncbi:MAG: cation:proton antiporter [Candidatus Cloacimonas sp.]|jgi:Kef-type K+ transport system membrane component KefB/mannitol/fructose-specific phosphotransferase system IIA component (Ntr-type)|nr:cation:proton antiporter [Candidatus Cloacimonas sp.]